MGKQKLNLPEFASGALSDPEIEARHHQPPGARVMALDLALGVRQRFKADAGGMLIELLQIRS